MDGTPNSQRTEKFQTATCKRQITMPNVPPGTEKVKEGIAGSMTTMRLKPSILCLAKFLLPPYNILIIKIPLG